MEHGYGIKRAENLIDRMEEQQGRTLFGPREKDLICNYAYHVEAFSKVEALSERLAQARFEVQNGYLDPALAEQVSGEIDRVDEIWLRQDETGVLEYAPVPFTEFEEHDLTGVEYLLETGEKLHFCPTSEDYFVSENRLADGTLTTPHIYRAVWDSDGLPAAFRQMGVAPQNYLAAAEMGAEQNYNQIDGLINNEGPRPSLLENLKQCKEQAGKAHDARDSGAPAKSSPEPER